MDPNFNPYVEWLGIPDGQPPTNYYALFGLALYEDDAESIAAASEAVRRQLRSVRPGEYAAYWQSLLDYVTAARQCLMDRQTKAAYDAHLQEQMSQPSAIAATTAPMGVAPANDGGVERRTVAYQEPALATTNPSEAVLLSPGLARLDEEARAAQEAAEAEARGRPIRLRRTKSNHVVIPWSQVIMLLVVLAGLAGGGWWFFQRFQGGEAETVASVGQPTTTTNGNGPVKAAANGNGHTTTTSPTAPANGPNGTAASHSAPTAPAPAATVAATPPAPVERKPVGPIDPNKQAAYKKAFADTRLALSRRDMTAARVALSQLEVSAQTWDEQDDTKRMARIVDLSTQFWASLRQRVAAMLPAEEIDLGNDRAIVVEIVPNELVIKERGKVVRYPAMRIPARLIGPIISDAVASDAQSKAMFAVFLTLDPEGNAERGKTLLAEAAATGLAAAKDLLPTESIAPKPNEVAPMSSKPAIDPERLKAAEQAVKQRYQKEYDAATTSAKKAELARQLLTLPVQNDGNVENRFAPLRQVYYLAVQAGDTQLAIDAVDRMNEIYQVDVLTAKLNALEEIVRHAETPAANKALADAAIGLANKAIVASRKMEAVRYGQVAVEAARKSNVAPLAKEASELHARAQAMPVH